MITNDSRFDSFHTVPDGPGSLIVVHVTVEDEVYSVLDQQGLVVLLPALERWQVGRTGVLVRVLPRPVAVYPALGRVTIIHLYSKRYNDLPRVEENLDIVRIIKFVL